MGLPPDVCGPNARGINDRLPLILFRAGVEIQVRGEAALERELGIDGRDYTTLAVLATDQPESQQDLARLMGKTPPLMVAAVDALEARGLVERRRSDRDRRRSVVEVTDAGRAILAKADAVVQEVADELLGGIPPEDREALHATLRRAMAAEPALAQASP